MAVFSCCDVLGDNCDKNSPNLHKTDTYWAFKASKRLLTPQQPGSESDIVHLEGFFSLVVRCQESLGRSSTPAPQKSCPRTQVKWCWCSPSSLVATASFSGGPPPQF